METRTILDEVAAELEALLNEVCSENEAVPCEHIDAWLDCY